jgi:hypothetical protein
MWYGLHIRWTREDYSRVFSALQVASTTGAVLRKVMFSVIRVSKCIQADGGHFEKLAWALNGESVTVHLKHISFNAQCSSFLSNLFIVLYKLINPEPLRIGFTCIWRFWLGISSETKSRNNDLNSWDILCDCVCVCVCVCVCIYIYIYI